MKLYTNIKVFFRFGEKDIAIKNNVVRLNLYYSPKDVTLRKKIGNLPLKYIRMKIDNEEDLVIFEKAVKNYNFNLGDEGTTGGTTQVNAWVLIPQKVSIFQWTL